MTKKKNHIYPEELPDNITTQEMDVGKQMGLSKDVISKFIFWQGEQWWQARMPPTDKYPEYPDGRIYFTKNARDPKVLNFAVDQVNGKARGNLKWTDGEGGNPQGRPRNSTSRITVKNVCDKMGASPVEMLTAVLMSDVGTLRKYGVRNPKEITLAQKLSIAKYLSDKLVPNLKPVEIGEGGDWEPNKPEGHDTNDNTPQIQVYIPGKTERAVSFAASEADIKEIESKGVDRYLEEHEVVDTEKDDDVLVWSVDKQHQH
jgi:hypothetical protein